MCDLLLYAHARWCTIHIQCYINSQGSLLVCYKEEGNHLKAVNYPTEETAIESI